MPSEDHYSLLGVSRNASPEEIRLAFRAALLSVHPDHNPESPSASEQTRRLIDAYRALSDPVKRKFHDASLEPSPAVFVVPVKKRHSRVASRVASAIGRGVMSLVLICLMAIVVVTLSDWIAANWDTIPQIWSHSTEPSREIIIYTIPITPMIGNGELQREGDSHVRLSYPVYVDSQGHSRIGYYQDK